MFDVNRISYNAEIASSCRAAYYGSCCLPKCVHRMETTPSRNRELQRRQLLFFSRARFRSIHGIGWLNWLRCRSLGLLLDQYEFDSCSSMPVRCKSKVYTFSCRSTMLAQLAPSISRKAMGTYADMSTTSSHAALVAFLAAARLACNHTHGAVLDRSDSSISMRRVRSLRGRILPVCTLAVSFREQARARASPTLLRGGGGGERSKLSS